jgi:hypothetical protein
MDMTLMNGLQEDMLQTSQNLHNYVHVHDSRRTLDELTVNDVDYDYK